MTTLEIVATHCAQTRLDQLSRPERQILTNHLLDTIGAAIAGCQTPTGQALRQLQAPPDGAIPVLTPGTIDDVARRVGTIRHTEADDIHLASNVTPSSVVVATALTMAARLGCHDPQVFGGALISGYEAMLRFGMLIDGPVVLYQGVWPTFIAAPIGAAAVVARLMQLPPAATAHALSAALTMSTGGAGRPASARPARWLVVGQAARAGVAAALAARAGFTSDLGLLDGNWLAKTHGLQAVPDAMTTGLGERCLLAELAMKPCCTGKQSASPLAAFQDLLADGLDAEAVTAVEIFVPQRYVAMIDRKLGSGPILSTFGNARYQFALAAFHPAGLYDAARIAPNTDARIATLMDKVSIRVDDALAAHFPQAWPARVEVATPDGPLCRTVIAAPGDPPRRFDRTATVAKFHAMTDALIGRPQAEDWIAVADGALEDAARLQRLGTMFEGLFA